MQEFPLSLSSCSGSGPAADWCIITGSIGLIVTVFVVDGILVGSRAEVFRLFGVAVPDNLSASSGAVCSI